MDASDGVHGLEVVLRRERRVQLRPDLWLFWWWLSVSTTRAMWCVLLRALLCIAGRRLWASSIDIGIDIASTPNLPLRT